MRLAQRLLAICNSWLFIEAPDFNFTITFLIAGIFMHTIVSEQPFSATTLKEDSIAKLQSRTANVGVIGLGYVGLPLALLFTEQGFRVTGFDIDSAKINMLGSLRSYICRIPQTEIALASDRGL